MLAALAAERTQATRLDGRPCRAIYEDARSRIDWQALPPNERDFAHVCRLAGMIVRIRYPEAGTRLFDAATRYFADHPEQQLLSAEIVRRGLVINAPRLRDRLERLLAG